jgi:hypothetical protein
MRRAGLFEQTGDFWQFLEGFALHGLRPDVNDWQDRVDWHGGKLRTADLGLRIEGFAQRKIRNPQSAIRNQKM